MVLVDVEVRTCPECGENMVVLPRVNDLMRSLAMTIINRTGKLTNHEVRYLRTWLGWSGQDFAKHFGVTTKTISGWETGRESISATAERLLRLAVTHGEPVDAYPVARLAELDAGVEEPKTIRAKASKAGWQATLQP